MLHSMCIQWEQEGEIKRWKKRGKMEKKKGGFKAQPDSSDKWANQPLESSGQQKYAMQIADVFTWPPLTSPSA